jgi:hypothetical protein
LTAVLAFVVSVTPNTSAASAAIACIRPDVFSRLVATFRATPGSTLVNHTAFSSGSLRRDRCTEAWNSIRDLASQVSAKPSVCSPATGEFATTFVKRKVDRFECRNHCGIDSCEDGARKNAHTSRIEVSYAETRRVAKKRRRDDRVRQGGDETR